jgi:O-antigen/teichoic acid export membrane protein
MQTRSLKENILLNSIKTLMGVLFPFITFPYASRILLPEGMGKVSFTHAIISYFIMIAGLGIKTYGIREGAKSRNNRIDLSVLASELFTINLLSTIIAYVFLFVAILAVPQFAEYRILLLVSCVEIVFSALGMDWLYGALEEYRYITIRSIAFQVIGMALLFLLVKTKDDYVVYAAIRVFATAGSSVLNFFHARRFVTFKVKIGRELKRHLKPIFILFSKAVASSRYLVLDTTMLGFISGDVSVGIYTAATKFDKVIITLIIAASSVLLPRLSYYIGQQDLEKFSTLTHKWLNGILFFSIPAMVGLYLLCPQLVLLLSGNEYMPAIPVMRIMIPIVLMISITNLIGTQIFIPLGKETWVLFSVIGGAAVNFLLNLFLIPLFGEFGAGFSTVCAETVIAIVLIIMARKYFNFKRFANSLLRFITATVCMGIAVSLVIRLAPGILLQTLVSIIVGGIVYIGILLLMHDAFLLSIAGQLRKMHIPVRSQGEKRL